MIKRQGHGMRETFTVRKQSFGVGVERTFPVHSPKIERIEVAARGDVRRAKLYYLRDRVGKRARVRERRYSGPEETVEPGLLHGPLARPTPTELTAEETVLEQDAAVEAPEQSDGGQEAAATSAGDGAEQASAETAAPQAPADESDVEPAARAQDAGDEAPPAPDADAGENATAPDAEADGETSPATSRRETPLEGVEIDRRLDRRAGRDRRRRAWPGARDPGVDRQALPDPERLDGADAARRPARARRSHRHALQRTARRRDRRVPPARRRDAGGVWQRSARQPGRRAVLVADRQGGERQLHQARSSPARATRSRSSKDTCCATASARRTLTSVRARASRSATSRSRSRFRPDTGS